MWIPVHHSWRLNERHYGALQGLNKAEMAAKFGEAQVLVWRRSYDTPPPALEPGDPRLEAADPRYAGIAPGEFPRTECLKDTVARFLPHWHEVIAPTVRTGKSVIIAAHGNSLRALVKYLDNVSDQDIVGLNIPTGQPAGLRARPRPEAARALLPRRRGDDPRGDGGGREPGQGGNPVKPVLLSVAQLPDFLTDRLREGFDFRDRVHERDPAALDAIAPRVRGIVASGEARVTRDLLARLAGGRDHRGLRRRV